MRSRLAIAVCALVLVAAFHLTPSAARPAPPEAREPAPTFVYGPTRADRDRTFVAALAAALAQQDANVAAWVANYRPPPKPRATSSTSARRSTPDAAPAEAVNYDTGSMEALICSIFVDSCGRAIRVARCESGPGLDPTARNRSGASGLFQIMLPMHAAKFEAHGWSADDWADPFKNATIAFEMSGGGVSWGPWAESRHCWG